MLTRAAANPALAPRPDQTPARHRTCTLPLACFTVHTTRPGDPRPGPPPPATARTLADASAPPASWAAAWSRHA